MKKSLLLALVVGIAMIGVLSCSKTAPVAETEVVVETEGAATAENAEPAERHDMVYACACGPDCDCGSVSIEDGTCSCGGEMAAAHVVKVDGNDALLCTCGDSCECEIDAADDTKCACGADLKRVSLEGNGLYHCACGES
ncbi:MAG: hypothetical protein ACC742_05765, partial [Thermoanaerobaculales bacterium]